MGKEDYPGQDFFHAGNPNIKRAEDNFNRRLHNGDTEYDRTSVIVQALEAAHAEWYQGNCHEPGCGCWTVIANRHLNRVLKEASEDLETFAMLWRRHLLAEREYFSKRDELETVCNNDKVARAWCRGTMHVEDNLGRITKLLALAARLPK